MCSVQSLIRQVNEIVTKNTNFNFQSHLDYLLQNFDSVKELILSFFNQTENFDEKSDLSEADFENLTQLLSDLFFLEFKICFPDKSNKIIKPKRNAKLISESLVLYYNQPVPVHQFLLDTIALSVS